MENKGDLSQGDPGIYMLTGVSWERFRVLLKESLPKIEIYANMQSANLPGSRTNLK